jgi:1-deoxy-D-xylulose-5-phosphate reductoisomerase
MAKMTPEQAVAHPNWDMGAKISVDSATMMNKGLELIEALHLFPVSGDQFEILVHPQSVIHSMVDYVDGSVLAQLGTPDMRTPIAYALAWPKRMAAHAPRLDLAEIATLTFEAPDMDRFPALRLARQALNTGGAAPTVLNAANEVAVRHFLDKNIGFLDIARIVEETLIAAPDGRLANLDDVAEADAEARQIAEDLVLKHPKDN